MLKFTLSNNQSNTVNILSDRETGNIWYTIVAAIESPCDVCIHSWYIGCPP